MASRKKNGSVADLTLEILVQIRDEARKTNERLDTTNERLDRLTERVDGLTAEVHKLRADTAAGLARHERAIGKLVDEVKSLNDRFDNFLTGAHQEAPAELRDRHDKLEARVERLEKKRAG